MKRLLLLALVLVAVATSACSQSEARPSGVTERWLQAVSEQGRDGLREEGTKRADELAAPEATANVRPTDAEPDERLFRDLEVGKAAVDIDQARVPFRVTTRLATGERRERVAVAVLVKRDDTWRVLDVVPRIEGEKVPSEGGDRPARANAAHWLIALVLSVVLTGGSILLIDRQPTSTDSAGRR